MAVVVVGCCCRDTTSNVIFPLISLVSGCLIQRNPLFCSLNLQFRFSWDCPTDKQSKGKSSVFFTPCFSLPSHSLSLFFIGISHFLGSIQLGRLEILHPIGRVEGLCRSPSLAPQVAEGTWVVNGALCTVFLRGGPLSPALICHRSLSVHAPQCLIVSAKSPGSRPDLNNAFLPNSDPGFRFSSTHKGILSYCPHFRRGLSLAVRRQQFVC